MEEKKLTLGEYCESLLDICQFLHCEMKYFLTLDGRFHGTVKTYWCNMKEAWIKMNKSVSEEDIQVYGSVLALIRRSLCKEFSRLKNKRLTATDRIIVLIHKLLEVVKENYPEDFRFKRELESASKACNRFFDHIRNPGKNDSMYVFSSKLQSCMEEGKYGKYQVDDLSLYKIEFPEPKKLELRDEKQLLVDAPDDVKRTEYKF